MKKIFISQPMRGKSPGEIEHERSLAVEAALELLGVEEVEVIDSYFEGKNNMPKGPLKCLGHSLIMLADADVAVFAPRWNEARGCIIEHEAALAYGISVLELEG